MRHLLAIADLERADVERIMERAEGFAEVGRRCVQGLLATIRAERTEPGTDLVPTILVERASTAPPPGP